MEIFGQAAIAILTCSSMWLIQRTDKWAKWGFVIGCIGFPFWLMTSIQETQWGIAISSIWVFFCNLGGILKRFSLKPKEQKPIL